MPTPSRTPLSRLPLAALCLALLAAAGLAGVARADKGINEGTYQDRDGKSVRWTVERSHLLMWDGKPYTPAGVVFRSEYLTDPSDGSYGLDTTELDRLKSAGVQDLWIDTGGGLLESAPEQTQKIIDAVEARGFRYGLRVGDRFREPLIGFSPVNVPQRVPVSRLQPGARETWEVQAPRSRRVVYALVQTSRDEKTHDFPIASGEVIVEQDRAQIEVQIRKSKLIGQSRGLLLTVPEVQVEPEELGSFGDLWDGMESYSARMMRHLKAVKFGPGLRFILDPFFTGDGTVGQEDQVFPSSDSFREGFRDWLSRRVGVHGLNTAWRLNDRRLQSLDEASRLVPMWARNDPPEGDGWLIDPVDKVAYRCIPKQCTIWTDLDNYRADTLKKWMNVGAVSIKQQGGPHVPVLFSWANYHPLFNNSPSPSGYDGLGAQLYGSGPAIARESAAYALAQAEESDRNTWLIATKLGGPASASGEASALDGSAARTAWAAIREVGFRGVFLDPKQTPEAASLAKELESAVAADVEEMKKPVPVMFFPMFLATADRVAKLSNGVWWIPSAARARMVRYGDTILGYEMDKPLGSEHAVGKGTVFWSTIGDQEVTFYTNKFARIALFDSAGKPIPAKPKKDKLKLTLSEEPIVATGLDVEALFPLELAVTQLQTFAALLDQAQKQGADVASMRVIYENARKSLSTANAAAVYNSVTPYVAGLRDNLMPFIWIEGERPASQNLSGVAFQAGASGGTYLKLDRRTSPLTGVYRARYNIDILKESSYEIWVAGRVPGRPGVSPLIWQIDDEPAVPVTRAEAVGENYAGNMAWFTLGRVTLKPGRHELTLVVPERAEGEQATYSAAFDAIVVSRDRFQPNGAEKPVYRAPNEPGTGLEKQKRAEKEAAEAAKKAKKGKDDEADPKEKPEE